VQHKNRDGAQAFGSRSRSVDPTPAPQTRVRASFSSQKPHAKRYYGPCRRDCVMTYFFFHRTTSSCRHLYHACKAQPSTAQRRIARRASRHSLVWLRLTYRDEEVTENIHVDEDLHLTPVRVCLLSIETDAFPSSERAATGAEPPRCRRGCVCVGGV
jgi:hypothetical protein